MKSFVRRVLKRALSPRFLNRVNTLSHIDDRLLELEVVRSGLAEVWLRESHPALFAHGLGRGPDLAVFSQNGEDGVLLDLLQRTGAPEKSFVEIGIEHARECNTALLAFVLGWDGLMLEASELGVAAAKRLASRLLERKPNRVEIRQALVTAENINDLIAGAGFRGELGVFSVDVDGVDYWLWKALRAVRPRLVVVEYNATFGPEECVTVPYKPDFDCHREHASGFYHGASLAALEKLGRELGYALAAVDALGVNAFFVREDILPPTLSARRAAELYRPHFVRSRYTPPAEQSAAIRHLPLVRV